jgi:ubiquinone/menaquinone biosynthesis C-methylase UbiE
VDSDGKETGVVDDADQRRRVRDAFTRQAATFEDRRLNQAFTSGLPRLLRMIGPRRDDICLDVAAGTGLIARGLAAHASRVIALDATPAMLREGRQQADREGLRNVAFLLGDAARLPCRADTFSVVVTRFSLHHFADPSGPLGEMVRACRRGGRMIVQDLAASTDLRLARRQDRLERLRDPSHVRMAPQGTLRGWLEEAGMHVTMVDTVIVERPVARWLRQALTETAAAAEVTDRFERELAGGEPTGLRPSRRDGGLWFEQTWETTMAVKP